jgi:hypothetical protein
MSQAARQEVQTLYRNHLRLLKEWPADKARPNKDMKQHLTIRVEETFRQPLQDGTTLDIAQVKKQYNALERLLANEFNQKVGKRNTRDTRWVGRSVLF